MKNRIFVLFAIAALLLPILAGCGQREAQEKESAARGSSVTLSKHQVSAVPQTKAPSTAPETVPTEAPAMLTEAEVETIALAHVGLTREAVTRLRTEYDKDDGVPQYEVEFYEGGWEYDFEIHAETGAILSYEKDD